MPKTHKSIYRIGVWKIDSPTSSMGVPHVAWSVVALFPIYSYLLFFASSFFPIFLTINKKRRLWILISLFLSRGWFCSLLLDFCLSSGTNCHVAAIRRRCSCRCQGVSSTGFHFVFFCFSLILGTARLLLNVDLGIFELGWFMCFHRLPQLGIFEGFCFFVLEREKEERNAKQTTTTKIYSTQIKSLGRIW